MIVGLRNNFDTNLGARYTKLVLRTCASINWYGTSAWQLVSDRDLVIEVVDGHGRERPGTEAIASRHLDATGCSTPCT